MAKALAEYLLIVANSGRMLAQAARQAGFIPLVIDLYADQDTFILAEAVFRVDAFNEQNLKAAIAYFNRRYPVSRAVYGSGLERSPECVKVLGQHFVLLGNDYATFRKIQNKRHFFALLTKLSIPHPEVAFDPPRKQSGWLVKPWQGNGGIGIRRFTGRTLTETAVYWQKMINGTSGSVLFLADGLRAQVIGCNTQWNSTIHSDDEFVFAGIVNESPLSVNGEQCLYGWIQRLVRAYRLKGLNTLDFMAQGDRIFVLEINPRPSASMQLYDNGILMRHVMACFGRFEHFVNQASDYCGYLIIYADISLKIPDCFQWPEGCMDLPGSGLIIRKGDPICSMIAREKSPQSVYHKLTATQQIIVKQLKEGL
ncbi:MAG: ATP-grasp domain-containing protein [Gammaproteobacteria bacterium]